MALHIVPPVHASLRRTTTAHLVLSDHVNSRRLTLFFARWFALQRLARQPRSSWRPREFLAKYFWRGGEGETMEQFTLSRSQTRGAHFSIEILMVVDPQDRAPERAQDGFRGGASFLRWRIGRNALPIYPLQEEVGREGHHHQKEKCFHSVRRLQEDGAHGQRPLELPVGMFGVTLLLELCKQPISAGLALGNGGHQHRVPVVGFILGQRLFVERKGEPIPGSLAAARWRRQRSLFFLRQRNHLPCKIACRLLEPEQLLHATGDRRGIRRTTAGRYAVLNLLESFSNFVDLLLPLLPHDFLVCRAEHKDHAAGNLVFVLLVNQSVPHRRQLIVFQRQIALVLAAALLFYRQKTSGFPRQTLAVLVEQWAEFAPRCGAHGVQAFLGQPPPVSRGERSTIGVHRQLGGPQMLADQGELLGHRPMSVLVAGP